MAKTRSMTRNQNYDDDDDSYSRKMIKTSHKPVVAPWSDLNHDVLGLVMMRLGVIDFPAFSRVCKSWRSFAVCNRKRFMASKPPMKMQICHEKECELMDFEGRKFKTLLPHSSGRICVGVTCGYLVLIGRETNDFWLVNPITRHQLHSPDFPGITSIYDVRATLVFSPSISGWLFVITKRFCNKIWFSIAGKGVWNCVSMASYIYDLHAFKGKVYAINIDNVSWDMITHFCEMRLGPEPKFMVLETKNFPRIDCLQQFASYGENLYVVEYMSEDLYKVNKLDFGEMEWVLYFDEKTITEEEFAFYKDHMGHMAAAKQESGAADAFKSGKRRVKVEHFWYFPHDSLDVNLMDE